MGFQATATASRQWNVPVDHDANGQDRPAPRAGRMGGIIMDRLIAGCRPEAAGLARVPTDVTSISGFAQGLNLSRSQLGRKFAAAEAIGSLGWCGSRGKSPLWVSAGFRREYNAAQAVKLSIIDKAFKASVAPVQRFEAMSVSA